MELVYLWVEDYKNIHKQGFNFSPRFECEFKDEYDDEGKLKDNCELIIKEKKDYVSIFPDNINVTAIVGENGSGKSNIIDSINNIQINEKKILIFSENGTFIMIHTFKTNLFITRLDNSGIYKIGSLSDNINFESFKHLMSLSNSTEKTYYIESTISLKVYKNYNNDIQNIIDLLNDNKIIIPFDPPNLLNVFILYDDTPIKMNENISYYLSKYKIVNNFIKNHLFFEDSNEYRYSQIEFYVITSYLHLNYDLGNTYDELVFECNIKKPSNIRELIDIYYKSSIIKAEIRNEIIIWMDQLKRYFNFKNTYFMEIEVNKIPTDFISQYKKFTSKSNGSSVEFFNILNFSLNKSLSDGEFQFLSIFSRIYKYLSKEINIICIDEGDIFFHPEWQKKYINYLIEFISNNFKHKIHLILTSHSPFILSDIPKENVIFLENGKKVNIDIDTFGANIHTLLSHGFFMKDGLMGEFAKDKIDTAIKYLNQTKLSDNEITYCENIISIIGEPIIKRQLQKMLDSKRLCEIDVIKKQIEDLQIELAKKENKK